MSDAPTICAHEGCNRWSVPKRGVQLCSVHERSDDCDGPSAEPLLGLATTQQLMRELIVRFTMTQYVNQASGVRPDVARAVDRALVLAEMLGGMNGPEREYRTVDGG